MRSVYVSTFGILFLGTPHNESDVAKWGVLLHNICSAVLPMKFMEASPQLVEALQKDNETLHHINSHFTDIMSRFHIYLFHETRSMDVKGTKQIIVDEESAAPCLIDVERMGIEADHSHICKFENENSPGYEVVAEAILRYSRQAPTVIADRWVEERKTRASVKKAKAREIYDRDIYDRGIYDSRQAPDIYDSRLDSVILFALAPLTITGIGDIPDVQRMPDFNEYGRTSPSSPIAGRISHVKGLWD